MAFVDGIVGAFFRLSRWLLHLWIRPTILGADKDALGIEDSDHVIYVLPFKSSADLLATDYACEKSGLPRPSSAPQFSTATKSYFFLNRPEGWFGRRSPRQQFEEINTLFQHQNMQDTAIKIVPVSLFWGHQPDREKSAFKLILSENWSVTNRFRKFLAMLFHPNHILIQFAEPINLQQAAREPLDADRQVRNVMRNLRVHFTGQKQAIIGPDLSHRRTLINTILATDEVSQAITDEAEGTDTPRDVIYRKAESYAKEIASDQSYRVIRFFHVLLTWLWNNLYDGIRVNNIDRVKEAARSHEIIYIPCHRSHIDYLLLSYVLYHNGLTPPHIAAGKNLNLPIVGTLLRRAGAFFMRRSFQGDPLYKAVFDEYMHQMFVRGFSVEYFIEGGRSRTGRTLVPRTGMLSMTMRSFQRDASMPICMMPVYFGYERVLESSTYLGELSGRQKKSESFFDMFGVFGSFRHRFGEVSVNFGEPLALIPFMDQQLPDWRQQASGSSFNRACLELSRQLATRINSATAVSSVGLVATALLSTPRQTIDRSHLVSQMQRLLQLVELEQYSGDYTVPTKSAETILEDAIEIAGLNVSSRAFGTTVSADQEAAVLLTYYKNNIAHLFALPSLVATFVNDQEVVGMDTLVNQVARLFPYIKSEFFLPFANETAEQRIALSVDNLVTMGLVQKQRNNICVPERSGEHYIALKELTQIIQPTLERFFILCSLISHGRHDSIRELEADAADIAEKLSAIYGINSPDFFERSLFSGFVSRLRDEGMLSSHEVSKNEKLEDLSSLLAITLDPDVQFNVLQAVTTAERSPASV